MLCQSLLEPSQQHLRSVHPTPLCSQEAVVYMGEVTLPKPHGQEMLGPLSSLDPRAEIVHWMLISHLLQPEGPQAAQTLVGGWVRLQTRSFLGFG